jgi:hypothetical protein
MSRESEIEARVAYGLDAVEPERKIEYLASGYQQRV